VFRLLNLSTGRELARWKPGACMSVACVFVLCKQCRVVGLGPLCVVFACACTLFLCAAHPRNRLAKRLCFPFAMQPAKPVQAQSTLPAFPSRDRGSVQPSGGRIRFITTADTHARIASRPPATWTRTRDERACCCCTAAQVRALSPSIALRCLCAWFPALVLWLCATCGFCFLQSFGNCPLGEPRLISPGLPMLLPSIFFAAVQRWIDLPIKQAFWVCRLLAAAWLRPRDVM
jgi:hypothetical protein